MSLRLTPMQRECLVSLSRGMTIKETGNLHEKTAQNISSILDRARLVNGLQTTGQLLFEFGREDLREVLGLSPVGTEQPAARLRRCLEGIEQSARLALTSGGVE